MVDLLRLLRCCSTLRRLTGESALFNASVAWSAAPLELQLGRWVDFALPRSTCVDGDRIPLSMWQHALPVMQYTVEQWERSMAGHQADWEIERVAAMKAAVANEQPTTTVRVGEQECVVLSELTWSQLVEHKWTWGPPCYRHLFVLSALPHLQHLHLAINPWDAKPKSTECDLFSLVPHLRSLHLEQCQYHYGNPEYAFVPIRDTLALLPKLTTLYGTALHVSIQDLIDMAAHATLEHIRLDGVYAQERDEPWLGYDASCSGPGFAFDSADSTHSTQHQSRDTEQDGAADGGGAVDEQEHAVVTADAAAVECERRGHEVEYAKSIQRLRSALNRLQPTQRSVVARLALADFLHQNMQQPRQLDDPASMQWNWKYSSDEVRHLRHQIAVLRSTFYRQLSSTMFETAE